MNVNPPQSERFLLPRHDPQEEYYESLARLNERQRRYHDNLVHMLKTQPKKQVLEFVSGGAGVGKSTVIHAITQSAIRIFVQQGGSPDNLTVLLMAPTGKAAFNIGGVTVHSALHIFNQNQQMSLTADTLNTLRSQLRHLKLIIIDEISMVGRQMFEKINNRLQQIFLSQNALGGLSVVVFGDFNQLQPVLDQWIFQTGRDDLSVLAGPSLWQQFKFYKLTEIMRQREDARFAEALNRLAEGCTTLEDDALFKSRETETLRSQGIQPSQHVVHLFATNEGQERYNEQYLASLQTESCLCESMDYCEGEGTAAAKQKQLDKVRSMPLKDTQGLPRLLTGKLSARYMVTVNINTIDGLTNGAAGTLQHIVWGRTGSNAPVLLRLYIQFDEEAVGMQTRNQASGIMQRDGVHNTAWTPIERVKRAILPTKGSLFKIVRCQFPLVPAKAQTIHKSQGTTHKGGAVVHITSRRMHRRAMYVALSRVTCISGIFIEGKYTRPSAPHNDSVSQELRRLNSAENQVQFTVHFPELHTGPTGIIALFHNIRSLHKHHRHVLNDRSYTQSDVLMICETWTKPEDDINVPGFVILHRRDCVKETRHPYGTVLYVRDTLAPHVTLFYEDCSNDFRGSRLHSFIDVVGFLVDSQQGPVAVLFLHKSPKCPLRKLSSALDICLNSPALGAPRCKTIVVGDFNLNIQEESEENSIATIMNNWGLSLRVDASAVSTDFGTLLDLLYTDLSHIEAYHTESMISDHKPLWFMIPYNLDSCPQELCIMPVNLDGHVELEPECQDIHGQENEEGIELFNEGERENVTRKRRTEKMNEKGGNRRKNKSKRRK